MVYPPLRLECKVGSLKRVSIQSYLDTAFTRISAALKQASASTEMRKYALLHCL